MCYTSSQLQLKPYCKHPLMDPLPPTNPASAPLVPTTRPPSKRTKRKLEFCENSPDKMPSKTPTRNVRRKTEAVGLSLITPQKPPETPTLLPILEKSPDAPPSNVEKVASHLEELFLATLTSPTLSAKKVYAPKKAAFGP